ncbi:glycosyltransferase family 2 protein [Pseudacidovorax sp. NFM-22]|uniref:glycosyltransferase family 2 protein n=1 Tax=Pseudacidovorax sp. NFM-22 TaxID=2744469 RepID=UPI001F43AD89|nr:glycosyltransferase family 2 protein [Pseudacidovorax sp. NFM-22]
MTNKICAVVVTFNRRELLLECIEALLTQSYPVSSVLVIDNASTDGTYEQMRSQYGAHDVVTYRRLPSNTGGAGGFNEGIKLASEGDFDFLWVMDDDAAPDATCLETLVSTINGEANTVAVAPRVVGLDGHIQLLHRGRVGGRLVPEIQQAIPKSAYDSGEIKEIDTASFVGLLFRATCVKDVGLPEAKMFIYNDDVEYCLRLKELGKLLLVPAAIIRHKDKPRVEYKSIIGKRRILLVPMARYGFIYLNRRNLVWTIKKHLGLTPLVLIKLFFGFFLESLKISLFMDRKRDRLRCLWMAFADGLSNKLGPVPEKIAVLIK